jgi:hypothetical protein
MANLKTFVAFLASPCGAFTWSCVLWTLLRWGHTRPVVAFAVVVLTMGLGQLARGLWWFLARGLRLIAGAPSFCAGAWPLIRGYQGERA